MLYRITLPYACFGIIVKNSIITEAPPIARWMVGKDIASINLWVTKKHGDIMYVNEGE